MVNNCQFYATDTMNYKTRPRINPKIIFYDLLPSTRTSLVIGKDNSDIVEVLKSKDVMYEEFKHETEGEIVEFLNGKADKKYDVLIFNSELCDYHGLRRVINLFLAKSHYSIIRFRNYNVASSKVTKRKRILKIIKFENIHVFKKIYSKKNFITKNMLFRPFSHYTVYFITKDKPVLNYAMGFIAKIKKFLFFDRNIEELVINKR